MGKVAIYARVSTIDKQDYNRQISDCKTAIGDKYSEDNIEIFAEKVSGYKPNAERHELLKMLAKIETDPKYYDVIYITEISRLGRDPRTTRNIIDDLTDKKVPIFITSINRQTLDEFGERDSIMSIILQVLMEFANSESLTMKRRSKSGILESLKRGNASGGKYTQYGYRKDENKQLVIDDVESIVIKEIFELYKNGNGFKKIKSILNQKKIPTRVNGFGNQLMNFKTVKTADQVIWSDKTINDIVTNPIYKGLRRIKGEKIIDGEDYDGEIIKRDGEKYKSLYFDAPAIISSELFDECQDILKNKTHRNYITTYDYLLKDLMTCGICGRNMFAKFKPVVNGDTVYICSSRLIKGGNCGNKGVNINYLDSVLYDMLIGQKALIDKIDKSDKMIPIIKIEIESITTQIKIEEDERFKLNKKVERLKSLYLASDMDIEEFNKLNKDFKKNLKNIDTKLSLLNKSLNEQNDILFKISNKKNDIDFLKNLSTNRHEIASIFKQFISRIFITKLPIAGDVLIDIHLKIGKQVKQSSLKLVLDNYVMRFRNPQYSYIVPLPEMLITRYDNGKLLNSEEEIYKALSTDIGKYKWIVAKENIMELTKNDF